MHECLSEIDEVLQDLKADDDKPQPGPLGDIQKLDSMLNDRYNKIYYAVTNMYMCVFKDYNCYLYSELQAVSNGAVIEGDISPTSHKQDSYG